MHVSIWLIGGGGGYRLNTVIDLDFYFIITGNVALLSKEPTENIILFYTKRNLKAMLSSNDQYEHIINIRNGWTKFSGRQGGEGGVNVLVNLFPQTVTIKQFFPIAPIHSQMLMGVSRNWLSVNIKCTNCIFIKFLYFWEIISLACENIHFSTLKPRGEERGETDFFAGYHFIRMT